MFGPAIALAIGAKFVPLRKPKKLPGMVLDLIWYFGIEDSSAGFILTRLVTKLL